MKISALLAGTALNGAERFPIVQNGDTVGATFEQFRAWLIPLIPEWVKGDPGGNAMAVGLFASIASLIIPAGTDLIQTSGWGVHGTGSACYRVGAAEDDPAEETRYSTNTANGRPVYLAEELPNVRQFGALAEFGTDDTAAFNAAKAYSKTILVSHADYSTDEVEFGDDENWMFFGARIRPFNDARPAFKSTNGNNWSAHGQWVVEGEFEPAATYPLLVDQEAAIAARAFTGAAVGIEVHVGRNWTIGPGLTVRNINGSGIRITGGLDAYPRTYGTLDNVRCYWNEIGIETVANDTSAEYTSILAPILAQNKIGIVVATGNVNVTGGQIVDNEIGVDLPGEVSPGVPSENHAHGIFSGVQINHNFLRGIRASKILNGHRFIGCHLYGDAPSGDPGDLGKNVILLDDCRGIDLIACMLASPMRVFGPNGRNSVINCRIPNPEVIGEIFEGDGPGTSARNQMIFDGNMSPNGRWDGNQPLDIVIVATRATSNQSITASTLSTIAFNNLAQDRRGDDFDIGAGEAAARITGWYDIETLVRILFDLNSFTGGDVFLKVVSGGTTFTLLTPLVQRSPTEARVRTGTKIFLNAGAIVTVVVAVDATSPVIEIGSLIQMTLR